MSLNTFANLEWIYNNNTFKTNFIGTNNKHYVIKFEKILKDVNSYGHETALPIYKDLKQCILNQQEESIKNIIQPYLDQNDVDESTLENIDAENPTSITSDGNSFSVLSIMWNEIISLLNNKSIVRNINGEIIENVADQIRVITFTFPELSRMSLYTQIINTLISQIDIKYVTGVDERGWKHWIFYR